MAPGLPIYRRRPIKKEVSFMLDVRIKVEPKIVESIFLEDANFERLEKDLIWHYRYDYAVHFMTQEEITKRYIEDMWMCERKERPETKKWRKDLSPKYAELLADLEALNKKQQEETAKYIKELEAKGLLF